MGQEFKQELIEKFYEADNNAVYTFYYNTVDAKMLPMLEKKSHNEYISLYKTLTAKIAELDPTFDSAYLISFLDLCEGGHVETLKDIPDGCFAMNKIAGAYRQGKEGNPMMTRIYGWAFDTKDALKAHLAMLEEAKKRDHRII
jgi:threonyl-tRNA synthetase